MTFLTREQLLSISFWAFMFLLYFLNYYYAQEPVPNEALSLTMLNICDIPIAWIHFHLWLPFINNMRKRLGITAFLGLGYVVGVVILAMLDGWAFATLGNLVMKHLTKALVWQQNFPEAIISMLSYEAVMSVYRLSFENHILVNEKRDWTQEKNHLELFRENMKERYENLLLNHKMLQLNQEIQAQMLKNLQLTEINKQKEIQQLRFSIDTHTLLNMMDIIYYAQNLEMAHQTAFKVKSLMSYILRDTEQKVRLSQEINFLKNYIDLRKLGLDNPKLKIDLQVVQVAEKWMIEPFILFVFVENVFKHGIQKVADEPWAKIRIEMKGNILHFHAINKKSIHNVGVMPDEKRKSDGIRLTTERLEILYPAKHTYKKESNNTVYEVHLTIELTEATESSFIIF